MNVMTKFTLRSLRAHKIRTLVTIAGVALAAALFTAVLACVSSLNGFLLKAEVAMSGDWTAYVYTDTLQEARAGLDNDSSIQESFAYTDVGFAAQPEEDQDNYGRYLSVLSAQGSWPLVALRVEEGRFPENGQEILLPTRFIGEPLFNVDEVQIGSTLTFEVGDRQLVALEEGTEGYTTLYGYSLSGDSEVPISFDVGETLNSSQSFVGSAQDGSSLGEQLINLREKTYTVVGFYFDNGYGGLTHSGMYSAITCMDSDAQGFTSTYVKTEGLDSVDAITNNLETSFDSPYVFIHTSLLRYMGIVDDRSLWSSLESIAMILGVIIAIACVVLVSNAFAISVTERIKQFGLLSSLGATKRQLAWSVMEEALIIALIGAPLGILIGLGATALTLHLLSPSIMEVLGQTWIVQQGEALEFSLVVNGGNLALAALFTVLVVVVSAALPALRAYRLNPIDAIRNAASVRKTKQGETGKRAVQRPWSGGISKAVFGIPGKISALNTQRSKGKNVVVSFALALAVVLLMTGGVVSTTFSTLLGAMQLEEGYDILVVGSVEDPQENTEALAHVYDDMCRESSATGLGWSVESPAVLSIPPSMIGPDALNSNMGDMSQEIMAHAEDSLDAVSRITFIDDESYKTWLRESGIDPATVYDMLGQGMLAAVGISEGYGNNGSQYVVCELFKETGEVPALFPGTYPTGEDVFDFSYDYTVYNESNKVLTTVGLYVPDDGTLERADVATFESEAVPLNIVALTANRPPVMNQGGTQLTVVAPISALKLLPAFALDNNSANFRTAFNAVDSMSAVEAINEVLDEFNSESDPVLSPYVDNVAERSKSANLLAMVVNIFCLLFTVVLMLIALASLFTTITNNLVLRAREFAVLQSVGLGPKDFRKMIVAECVGYGMRGIIPGLILSFVVSVAVFYALSISVGGITYVFPWNYALLALVLIAVMIVISVAYGMHCLKAQTPAEVLSGE